jgi:NADH-quinone oxidoreductase subunit K
MIAALIASVVLFGLGAAGALTRKDLLRVLLSVSIMLGGVTLLLVALATTPAAAAQQHVLVLFAWAVEIAEILIAITLFVNASRIGAPHLADLRNLKW